MKTNYFLNTYDGGALIGSRPCKDCQDAMQWLRFYVKVYLYFSHKIEITLTD